MSERHQKPKRTWISLISDVLEWTALILAVGYGQEWAGNALRFWAWVLLPLALLVLICVPFMQKPPPRTTHIFGMRFSYLNAVAFTLALAGIGWFWTAGAWALGNLAAAMAGITLDEKRAEARKAESLKSP